MGNNILSFLFLFCLFLLAGCWDQVEIDENAFMAAIAIDLAEEQGEHTTFELTEQLIVPSGLGTIIQPGDAEAYRNLSQTGESIYDINTSIFRQENRKINIEHLDLIIVSSELAQQEHLFANVLNVFIRQQFMRRGILIAITHGKAKNLLNITPEHAKVPALYITELLENNRSAVISEPLKLGEIQEKLLTNRSYVIPELIIFSPNSIDYEGLAVFQEQDVDSKQVGKLNRDEAKGLHFIIGKDQKGSVTASVDGEQTSFNIIEGSSEYKLLNKDKNRLHFQIDIELIGDLMEYYGTEDFNKESVLKKFEKVLEDEVKKIAEMTLEKLKMELKVDVIKFDDYLRVHHNKLWEEIKADWDQGDNFFSKSEITVNVKAEITEPGTSVRVNSKGD